MKHLILTHKCLIVVTFPTTVDTFVVTFHDVCESFVLLVFRVFDCTRCRWGTSSGFLWWPDPECPFPVARVLYIGVAAPYIGVGVGNGSWKGV